MAVKLSKYTLAWRKLRDEKKCEFIAAPESHKKIVHNISKKKDLDLEYKLIQSEQGTKEKIVPSYEGNKVTLILVKTKIGINDL